MGRVTVVGAGVIGLSCALRLLEAGHRVDVLARDLPRETTSAVAAAIWYPYRAWPEERVLAWSRTSYDAFAAMAAEEPDSGVVMREGTEVVRDRSGRPVSSRGGPTPCPTCTRPSTCPPGTTAAGRSPRRSSRCPSTSTGWPVGCWRPAAPSLGSTCTGCRAR